ncbi:hypothetical protein [Agriterribacter sp.]|uniref:hypothetical protein n=1 Tax=Agriterribacter sp. TaxID=2821509 RepID=UPI002BD980AC|nr:hypothetical protein [Agriterribacter sp.]HTN08946.1 hypothetical protein [Agriterribacter sp.]
MSLKNIILPENVIASLYSAPIICMANAAGGAASPAAHIKFLGSNQKHITILVNASDAPFLSDKSFIFLTGVLTACRLNVADVAIINIHQSKNNHYLSLNAATRPQTVLLFGVSPQEIGLPLHFPHFQVQPFNNTTYVCAPALDSIEADKPLKAKLWVSLKSVFQL